jgi:nucleotidyltransferase substrate binding protein (TIGR01987 family)
VDRLSERLADATHPLACLQELAARVPRTVVERDAAIMRFTYTFEAAWKAAQQFLSVWEGLDVGSPKESVRASRRVGLLSDDEAHAALRMTDDRNLIVHVYREAVARDLDSRLAAHAATLAVWIAAMQHRSAGG